jgi:DNA invertase Pin-like site-specific DNA recombinase
MATDQLIPAAQYLRMSTEHQQYSFENQMSAIQRYAQDRGFMIVKSYEDSARSGLRLQNRPGLQELCKAWLATTLPSRQYWSLT